MHLEAKAIREKVYGKEHPEYASALNNLANLYRVLGQYEQAEPLYLEAKAIFGKLVGMEHPEYARVLNILAILYIDMGQYEQAEPLFIEAKAIYEKVHGKEHPEYAPTLNNLAILYGDMGKYEQAENFFLELSIVNRLLIEKALRHLSERELNNYLNTFAERQSQILSFTQVASSKKTIPACYDNSLFYKGFLLQAAGQIKRLALSNAASTEKFNTLKGYQRRLAAQYSLPISDRDSAVVADLE